MVDPELVGFLNMPKVCLSFTNRVDQETPLCYWMNFMVGERLLNQLQNSSRRERRPLHTRRALASRLRSLGVHFPI